MAGLVAKTQSRAPAKNKQVFRGIVSKINFHFEVIYKLFRAPILANSFIKALLKLTFATGVGPKVFPIWMMI
jgi:hypothetical protein